MAELPSDAEFVATHIQIDEISRTKDPERRSQLLLKFITTAPAIVPTESGVWGTSRWGQSKWSDGQRLESIIFALDERRRKPNNVQDALIAEVAMANGYGLITADRNLADVMKELNVAVVFLAP